MNLWTRWGRSGYITQLLSLWCCDVTEDEPCARVMERLYKNCVQYNQMIMLLGDTDRYYHWWWCVASCDQAVGGVRGDTLCSSTLSLSLSLSLLILCCYTQHRRHESMAAMNNRLDSLHFSLPPCLRFCFFLPFFISWTQEDLLLWYKCHSAWCSCKCLMC